jgi:hypothetical protein
MISVPSHRSGHSYSFLDFISQWGYSVALAQFRTPCCHRHMAQLEHRKAAKETVESMGGLQESVDKPSISQPTM